MNMKHLFQAILISVFCCSIICFTPAAAQLISLKTAPVASGDQFLVLPSERLGMGQVQIAGGDHLLDPFRNPATGVYVRNLQLFSAPVFYYITGQNGSARTLPVGGMIRHQKWFGGFSAAVQELLDGSDDDITPEANSRRLSQKSANNLYLSGYLGKQLPGDKYAFAAGVSWAGLEALDGADLLYGNGALIEQDGHLLDIRLGLTVSPAPEQSLEFLLLHSRFRMTQDVIRNFWWRNIDFIPGWQTEEHNKDYTNTWGGHLRYRRPVGNRGWRVGAILTGNYKHHPKIPNYDIMNIPRDPGISWAANLGLGVERQFENNARFGFDLILQPARSHTWANADSQRVSANGWKIRAGDKIVDNQFTFSNSVIRIGLSRENPKSGLQLGLQVRTIRYTLVQKDFLAGTRRKQKESWSEWTPSIGLLFKFPEFNIRYAAKLSFGTGRPGVDWFGVRTMDVSLEKNDFLIAPAGPLTLENATVFTHQLQVSIPIHN